MEPFFYELFMEAPGGADFDSNSNAKAQLLAVYRFSSCRISSVSKIFVAPKISTCEIAPMEFQILWTNRRSTITFP
jgi:hypothetical protein